MPTETMDGTANGTSMSSGQGPERLQDAASGILDQAGRTATTQASRTMARAGDTLKEVARAVRETGGQMRESRPEIAGVTDTVAERVEQLSSYLREHDAQEVLSEAERLARRQPALVVGGGLVVGLLIGRLLRSGAEPAGGQGSTYGSTTWTPQSSLASRPGSGYGTGYGGSYGQGTGSTGSVGDSLAATDIAASGGTGEFPTDAGEEYLSPEGSATTGSTSALSGGRSTGAE
ncbi:MAG: hypothetical protein QOF49_1731 [Chloroflexota bacterium]|jgi:ElaB/YqjD/DUF883 family membrane-anchored ribosome-binding protein|nr:hypothetical protein [Chloroflexota bacterium]